VTDHREQLDVAAAAQGDARAFERIYIRHEARLRAMFVARVRDQMVAEDLTQETFVMAWRKLPSLKNPAALSRWLRRIGMNVLYDRARNARRDPMRDLTELEETHLVSSSVSAIEALDLKRAIAGLPRRYRHAFVLHHVAGFSHAEISKRLGVPEGTSKIHVHRATHLLRKALSA
jgi:RNA polymerase sigma-70 factor (ECF subfamily)